MDYFLLKLVHVISATILFGTGLGSAFYMYMANKTNDIASIYFATRHVVIADWVFTTPSVIVQFVTGILLVNLMGYSLTSGWVLWALMLYFFSGICWIPVVWLQIKMRDMSKLALENNTKLPEKYWNMAFWWTLLGALAFPAVTVIFYLMIYRPS